MFKLFLMTFILVQNSYANEKLLYVLGGGGDPAGESTIFDSDLKNLSAFTKNSNWKTSISFNGGHSKTEKIIKDNFANATNVGNFVEKKYLQIIDEITKKLENNELKTGDQLMLILNTHGAQKSKYNKEMSHSISLSGKEAKELNDLTGADLITLDKLEPVIQLAKKKGVKLAFIDESCHSGASLILADTDACVVTASGPNHYGYEGADNILGFPLAFTFSAKFNNLLSSGKNIEEIFIKARMTGNQPDFPMISTPEGKNIQDLLYTLITPYLNYNNSNSNKLDQMFDIKNIDEVSCNLSNRFGDISDIINQMERMKNISLSSKDFEELKAALNEYRNYQINYIKSYTDLKSVSKEIKDIIAKDYPNESKIFTGSDGISILEGNYDFSIKFYQSLLDKEKNDYSKKIWSTTIDSLNQQKKIVMEVKNKLPKESIEKIDAQKEMFKNSSSTYDLAKKVSYNMKKVYNALYKANKDKKANPCSDFVL